MKAIKFFMMVCFTIFSVSVFAQQISSKKSNQKQKASFYCPMKCEGEKTYPKSGKCPKCKMNLIEKKAAVAKAYFCPMKCEGDKTYDKPGKCPVCKMNLKEKTDDHSGHKH